MPLYCRWGIRPGIEVWLWRIVESEVALRRDLRLTPDEEDFLATLKHARRRREWLAVRRLAYRQVGLGPIRYRDGGAPFVSGRFVSISHADGWAALAVGNVPMGLDIEILSPRILPLCHRFSTLCEAAAFPFADRIKRATVIWTLKEATYKLTGGRVPQYKSGMLVRQVCWPASVVEYETDGARHLAGATTRIMENGLVMTGVWEAADALSSAR